VTEIKGKMYKLAIIFCTYSFMITFHGKGVLSQRLICFVMKPWVSQLF